MAGVPNRDGRKRKQIGRRVTPGEGKSVLLNMGRIHFAAGETVSLKLDFHQRTGLREDHLNRALCKCALNILAHESPSLALESSYDPLRTFVRSPPGPAARWPYYVRPHGGQAPAVFSWHLIKERGQYMAAYLHVFAFHFVVPYELTSVARTTLPRQGWHLVEDPRWWHEIAKSA